MPAASHAMVAGGEMRPSAASRHCRRLRRRSLDAGCTRGATVTYLQKEIRRAEPPDGAARSATIKRIIDRGSSSIRIIGGHEGTSFTRNVQVDTRVPCPPAENLSLWLLESLFNNFQSWVDTRVSCPPAERRGGTTIDEIGGAAIRDCDRKWSQDEGLLAPICSYVHVEQMDIALASKVIEPGLMSCDFHCPSSLYVENLMNY